MSIDFAAILYFLSIPAMMAVAIVLFIGLFTMMKGGSSEKQNKLMFMRVLLQGVAVLLMVGAVFMIGTR